MAENVKVYEEKKGLPILAWLLPLLLLLAFAAYFLTHHGSAAGPGQAEVTNPSGIPELAAIHFDTDQATLTPQAKLTLDRAASYLKHHPGARLRLEGYTDSTGTATHNDTLSDRRTNATADYLKSLNVDGSRLTGGGFGESKPVDTNATASGKADNRRVEIFAQP